MEERPEDTRIDEEQDVEGHKHHSPARPGAPASGARTRVTTSRRTARMHGAPHTSRPRSYGREDEGDDVEAHGPHVHGAPQRRQPRSIGREDEDEDDDVEAHAALRQHRTHGKPQHG